MTQYNNLNLDQNPNNRTTYGTQRWYDGGRLGVYFYDITITYSDMVGGRIEHRFEWVELYFALYGRSQPVQGMTRGAGYIRKYWGRDSGWVNLGSVGTGASYSIVTQLNRWRINGNESNRVDSYSPWMGAKFHVRS